MDFSRDKKQKMKKIITMVLAISSVIAFAQKGRVGVNTENPSTTLHIKNYVATDEPLRLENLQKVKPTETNELLFTNADGVVRKAAPETMNFNRSVVFTLPNSQILLNEVQSGQSQEITTMNKVTADITGVTSSGNTISFGEGVYTLTFTYAAAKNGGIQTASRPGTLSDTQCTISSYYIDFPSSGNDTRPTTRIHSNQSHNAGGGGTNKEVGMEPTVHGGTINYVLEVPKGATKSMKLHIGRGAGGNCEYNTRWESDKSVQRYGGMTLHKGTSFTVTKVQ